MKPDQSHCTAETLRARQRDGEPRVLVISQAFPPNGVVGSLRVERIVDRFAREGCAVDVIMRSLMEGEVRDDSRVQSLHPAVEVHMIRQREMAALEYWRKFRAGARAATFAANSAVSSVPAAPVTSDKKTQLYVPSSELGWLDSLSTLPRRLLRSATFAWEEDAWVADAVRYAMTLATSRSYSLVLSSGPPHAAHIAAAQVARNTRVPFVADLRDPWGGTELVSADSHTPWLQQHIEKNESQTLESAARVVLNTEAACRAFRERFPHLSDRTVVVYNGVDVDDAVVSKMPRTKFRIVFTGSLYFRRDPNPTFRAIRRFVEQHGLTPSEVELHMMGHVRLFEGQPVEAMARDADVLPYVRFHMPGPRSAALELSATASVLVTFGIHSGTQVPAKLFEYTDFEALLLVEAPADSAAALLLADSPARVVEPGDVSAIADALADAWAQFKRGEPFAAANADGRFSREAQLDKLFRAVAPYLLRAPVAA